MIELIQKEIEAEFIGKKIQPYSMRMNIEHMIKWSIHISNEFSLDSNKFEASVKEIFWGAAALQMNVGYIFLSLKSSLETGGKKRTTKTLTIPENYGMPELHCWYHLSNCWESVYRIWERVVSILVERFTPNISKKFYFTDYAKFIKNENIIFKSDAEKLDRFFKHWSNVAKNRNEISHGNFNPFKKMKICVRPSGMISPDFKAHVKADYQFPNLKQEVDGLLNSIEKTFELINTHIALCELKIQPNKKIMGDSDTATHNVKT